MVVIMSWDIFDEIMNEIRKRIRDLEAEIRSYVAPLDDIDEEAIEPLSTINETTDHIVVTVDLPLVKHDSIEVKLMDNSYLVVKAKLCRHIESCKIDATYPDITFKKYKKVIPLPKKATKIEKISVRRDIVTVYLSKY